MGDLSIGMAIAHLRLMFARVPSATLQGVDAVQIDVEVDVATGQVPSYRVVGLPATSVKEGAMRIRSALGHIGQKMPSRRITINLAPTADRKSGAGFDLPIAIAILVADQSARLRWPRELMVMGELGLDGSVRDVPGALAAAQLAKARGMRGMVVPAGNATEAAEINGIEVLAASHLGEVVEFLAGRDALPRAKRRRATARAQAHRPDMADVRGQPLARFGLEVAVAGGHNLLLLGPPGAGKTMLARRLPALLPPISRSEAIETTKIYSAIGVGSGQLVRDRPFRSPHHTCSAANLVGGGSPPRPGEISLAHGGVLFLDELAEFSRSTLETLRQPLESRCIAIGRACGTVKFPASFLLVAAANACPCGWHGSTMKTCTCSNRALESYRKRLSGPLLDRIDLQMRVRSVSLLELRREPPGESSATIRERIVRARGIQARRLRRFGVATNAEMNPAALRATSHLDPKAEHALERLQAVRGFSARGLERLIKVARTIADLGGRENIATDDIVEAANLRALESEPRADPRYRKGAAQRAHG